VNQNESSLKEILENEKELNRRLMEADLMFWYQAVKEQTYTTAFVPLYSRSTSNDDFI